MDSLRTTEPVPLASLGMSFDDSRLPEMLFRYRARNWPETLSGDEKPQWEEYRRERLTLADAGGSITLSEYRQTLAKMMIDPAYNERDRDILSQLADWPAMIGFK